MAEEKFKIISPDQVDKFTKDGDANLLLGAGYSLKIDSKGFIREVIPPATQQPGLPDLSASGDPFNTQPEEGLI